MYITSGSPKELLEWFDKQTNRYLCLFVGGSLNDNKILEEILNHKESIHSITGINVFFILFWDGIENVFLVEKGGRGDAYPGILLSSDKTHSLESIELRSIWNDDVKKNIIERSQLISNEICELLRIDPKKLPCLIVLEKGWELTDNLFVLPIKDSPSIRGIFSFFRELSICAKNGSRLISDYNKLNNTIYYNNKRLKLTAEKEKFQKELLDREKTLPFQKSSSFNKKLDDFIIFLKNNEVDNNLLFDDFKMYPKSINKTYRTYEYFLTSTEKEKMRILYKSDEYKERIKEIYNLTIEEDSYNALVNRIVNLKRNIENIDTQLSNTPKAVPIEYFKNKKKYYINKQIEFDENINKLFYKYSFLFKSQNIFNIFSRMIGIKKIINLIKIVKSL